MKMQVQWKVVIIVITSTVVALLFLREVVRQWSKLKQPLDDDFDCTNGTKVCLLGKNLHLQTLVNKVPDHRTVPTKTAKMPREYNGRLSYAKKKRSQRRKPRLPKRSKKHTYMMEVHSWPQALGPGSFGMADFEDTNISEDANLETEVYTPEDNEERSTIAHQNASTMDVRLIFQQRPIKKPESVSQHIMPPFPKANVRKFQYEPHPPDPEQLISNTMSDRLTVDLIFSYVVGGFLATTLVLLSVLIAGFIINCHKACCRKRRRCKRFSAKEQPEMEVDSDLNLSMLPRNLENFLVKQLDVRCRGQRSYGWQKVGEVFNINRDDLRYLKLEYKRDNGSPTSKLLEMLGITKNKTISDLVEVLKSPEGQDVMETFSSHILQLFPVSPCGVLQVDLLLKPTFKLKTVSKLTVFEGTQIDVKEDYNCGSVSAK